jgi:hypothetical protein
MNCRCHWFTLHAQQAASSKQQAASSKQQAASSKQQAAERPLGTTEGHPITLSVGYGWSEHAGNGGLNDHWDFLRKEVEKAAAELTSRAANRSGAQYPLKISIHRLRGRHGTTLFGGILQKIDRSDILFFDISGKNPNVHFELGYAIAKKGADSGRIYIFSELGKEPCSDLTGYMLSQYQPSTDSGKTKKNKAPLELVDSRGFRSALVASLIEVAKERDMWGQNSTILELSSSFDAK